MIKIDPLKLKAFDYSKIKEMEKNPTEIMNSKILLLQSLINESNSNKKKYQEIINSYITRFNELGYDYTQLDKDSNKNNANEDKVITNAEKKEENKDNNYNNENKNDKDNNNKENNDEKKNDNDNNNKENNDENINNNANKEENEDIVNFKD